MGMDGSEQKSLITEAARIVSRCDAASAQYPGLRFLVIVGASGCEPGEIEKREGYSFWTVATSTRAGDLLEVQLLPATRRFPPSESSTVDRSLELLCDYNDTSEQIRAFVDRLLTEGDLIIGSPLLKDWLPQRLNDEIGLRTVGAVVRTVIFLVDRGLRAKALRAKRVKRYFRVHKGFVLTDPFAALADALTDATGFLQERCADNSATRSRGGRAPDPAIEIHPATEAKPASPVAIATANASVNVSPTIDTSAIAELLERYLEAGANGTPRKTPSKGERTRAKKRQGESPDDDNYMFILSALVRHHRPHDGQKGCRDPLRGVEISDRLGGNKTAAVTRFMKKVFGSQKAYEAACANGTIMTRLLKERGEGTAYGTVDPRELDR